MIDDSEILTRDELLAAVRKPGRVFVGANLTGDDVWYVEAVKIDLIHKLESWQEEEPEDTETMFYTRRDEDGDLWIG